jgi:hypothetical protein
MSYNTRVTGEIAITPPIAWGAIKDSPFLFGDDRWPGRDVGLRIVEETVDTDEGTLIRRHAVAVVPAREDGYKAYSIVEHLQELVNQFGAEHTFTGMLEGEGEDSGDLWRLTVRHRNAVKVVPQIVWPDEGPVR